MADDGRDDIFVYLGGDQEVPRNVRRVVIDRSVNIIPAWAFCERIVLVSAETHEGIEKVEEYAFYSCRSLRKIKLIGVREVEYEAFYGCFALTDVEFGDKLERIGENAFQSCHNLQRIAIPLKDNIFPLPSYSRRCNHFDYCRNLKTVDLVGVERIHKFISSLFLQSWRDEMIQEIDQINQVLPNTPHLEKTDTIRLGHSSAKWSATKLSTTNYWRRLQRYSNSLSGRLNLTKKIWLILSRQNQLREQSSMMIQLGKSSALHQVRVS